jgi:hypothetical protein
VDQKDKAAEETWRRSHLHQATGHRSSKDCDAGRDFDRACARFEELAEAGYKFQLRLINGDVRRIRFAIQKVYPPFLKQFPTDQDLHKWLRGIARNVTQAGWLPELHELDATQIRAVTQIARTAANDAKPEGTRKR